MHAKIIDYQRYSKGLERAGDNPYLLICLDAPGESDRPTTRHPRESPTSGTRPPLPHLKRPGQLGWWHKLRDPLALLHLGHHEIPHEVDLSVDARGEDVAAILDPDQIVHAIAADPALTKRVGRAFCPRHLGPCESHSDEHPDHQREDWDAANSSHLSTLLDKTSSSCCLSRSEVRSQGNSRQHRAGAPLTREPHTMPTPRNIMVVFFDVRAVSGRDCRQVWAALGACWGAVFRSSPTGEDLQHAHQFWRVDSYTSRVYLSSRNCGRKPIACER